jgi:NADH-quinone oxidoreductase subunit K
MIGLEHYLTVAATLFVLTVAAAEAAIGLAILVCFFRNRGTIAVEDVNMMKG